MLAKLRVKFVSLAALTLLICLTLVLSMVFFLTDNFFDAQVNTMLTVLLENGGEMPPDRVWAIGNKRMPGGLSEELQYETRYFSVITDKNGNITHVNTEHIFSIEEAEAEEIAYSIYEGMANDADMSIAESIRKLFTDTRWESGKFFHENNVYYYDSMEKGNGSRLYVFVDCTSRYLIVQQIYSYLLVVAGVILLVFCLLFIYFSKQLMDPFIENQERQKRFITNASHELKTPLTVISANTEMIEMTSGKTKWTESNIRQIKKLNELVSNLVVLSKLNEKDVQVFSSVDISGIVKDQAESFASVVEGAGKKYELNIEEGLTVKAVQNGVQEVTSILIDNASKYCDDGGRVLVKLEKGYMGKGARLYVQNTYRAGATVDYTRFFERFYREDESHNSKKSGFGIGLSIAEEMCAKMNANIQVSYDRKREEIMFTVTYKQ